MNERGSVSVLIAGITAAAVVCVVGLGISGRLLTAWAQAGAAADAAALAAAPATFLGGSPAGEAARLAVANGATLEACSCQADSSFEERTVTVRVVVGIELPFVGRLQVPGVGRAEFDPMTAIGLTAMGH